MAGHSLFELLKAGKKEKISDSLTCSFALEKGLLSLLDFQKTECTQGTLLIRLETEPSDLSPAGKHRYLSPKELIFSFIYQDLEGLQLEGISTHHKQPQRRKMTGLRRRKERGKDTSF